MQLDRIKKYVDAIWMGREEVNARLEELARFICPDARGFSSQLSDSAEGREDVWDSTPEEAAGMLAAALGSLLTNPATAWFSLDLAGQDEEDGQGGAAGEWLTRAARAMLDALAAPESCFYQETDPFYVHLVSLGYGVLFFEYRDGRGLYFKSLPPKECALAENADGLVDTLVRRFAMTAVQLAEEFGADKLSDAVKSALESDPQKRITVTHLVCPKAKLPPDMHEEHDKEMIGSPEHAFVSIVFEEKAEKPLKIGGYYSFPFVAPRWSRRAGGVYGRGPGHAALPDIRVLNRISLSQLDAAEKASNTPILAPDDSVLDRKINTFPGGVTWYRPSGGEFVPLPVAADLGTMQAIRQERQETIRRIFLNDRIQLVGGPDMTATEVLARQQKQMQALSPVLGRLQSEECLGRLVGRVFELLWRNGKIDKDLPDGLEPGRNLQVRYVSPISRSQKKGEAESFSHALQFCSPLIQMRPELMDNFDQDAIVRDSAEVFGYPAKYMAKESAVKEQRAARAQAQAQAAQAQAALELAKAGGAAPAGTPPEGM